MKRILLLAALLLANGPAFGQSQTLSMAKAVTACGGQSLTNGKTYPLTQDLTGKLCDSSTGGGAAVTIANGTDVAEGNTADAAATAGGVGTLSAKLRLMTSQLATIAGGITVTGAVTIADGTDVTLGAKADAICGTATGTCTLQSLVKFLNTAATSAIPAGTAIIGKVGIDQTTPGTTNLVSLSAETVKVIGTVNQGTSPWVVSGTSTVSGTVAATQSTSPWIVAGGGTAGTATSGVVTVQGIASMTKLLVTPDANSAVNIAQVNGITASVNTGAVGTGTQRVAVGTDTATIAGSSPGTAGTASANVVTTQNPAPDPCHVFTSTYTPISVTSATTTRIVSPTSAKKTYICYMFLLSAIANNIGIVEGTGGTCGSSTAGVVGGTTAANGINLAANSGAVFQAGGNAAVATAGTNVDLCLITSAAGPLAGHIKWVQAP